MRDTHMAWNSVLLLACIYAGCSMVLTEASKPEVRYVLTPLSPTDTYARAQRAATKMGAAMLREDAGTRTFVVTYKEAIALHVHVHTVEEGTQMTVTGSILPKHVAVGPWTAVDEFVVAYRKEAL